MIRTFGLGPRAKKCLFWAFGIGPPAKIVGKSQGKRKNNASGKMAVFGPFFGPWMVPNRAKNGVRILTVFSLFLVFSHHVVTLI